MAKKKEKKKCPCPSVSCPRHGNCVACREYHYSTNSKTACGK